MHEGIAIRHARPEDMERVSSLSAPFVEAGQLVDRSLAQLGKAVDEFIVASHCGRPVGCAGTVPAGKGLLIYNLCIATEWQGRGVGRRLVEVAMGVGHRQGYQSVLAVSRYGGEWFEGLGFSRVLPSETREEWRNLFRPGRNSGLYQLKLAAEHSNGPK
ncbi:GNAT family N-acetyltransferase [Streptomyces albidoflavus]